MALPGAFCFMAAAKDGMAPKYVEVKRVKRSVTREGE